MAIFRAGAGARARAGSLEMCEFEFVDGAALSLFFAAALTPSASESSPVLVVAAFLFTSAISNNTISAPPL